MSEDVITLSRLISDEVVKAMNQPANGLVSRCVRPVIARATRRFSALFTEADRIAGERGLAEAARWLLPHLVRTTQSHGEECIPHHGPLVIASNHPGTVDSLVITASVDRPDYKILAGDIPFLEHLQNISRFMIYTPYNDTQGRMQVVRESIRHLQSGGALLLFARAGIDPDPAFMPGAPEELGRWSRSLEIFLRSVPQTRVLISIVSGVLDPRYMRHPITWLRRARPDRQRLAMMIQIIQQMLGKQLDLTPRVSFGAPLDGAEHTLDGIIASARRLLGSHQAWQS